MYIVKTSILQNILYENYVNYGLMSYCLLMCIYATVPVGFCRATRPYDARIRIFRLTNKLNGALHTPPPVHHSFVAYINFL
jgi:hypothetical protein